MASARSILIASALAFCCLGAAQEKRFLPLTETGRDLVLVDGRRRMAADRVIVRTRLSQEALEAYARRRGGVVRRKLGGSLYVIELPRARVRADAAAGICTADDEAAAWSAMAGIEAAEPDLHLELHGTPNDPDFPTQYGLTRIHAPDAWERTTGNPAFTVAVIDSGVAYDHPDLAANIWTNPDEIAGNGLDDDSNGLVDDIRGWDFALDAADPYDLIGHGTHVAGTIGAAGDNGTGVTGVCWNVRLMCLKVADANGVVPMSAAAAAIQYAASKGCRVASNAYGTPVFSQILFDAIAQADAAGLLCVASAGNTGADNDAYPIYPASFNLPNVLSVAATDANDAPASFSNFGASTVHLSAPGAAVYSTFTGGGYAAMSGTSSSVGFVAGGCALAADAHPSMTHREIRDAVLRSAHPLEALKGRTTTGARLNVNTLTIAGDGRDGPCSAGTRRSGSLRTLLLLALCALVFMLRRK